MDNPLLSICIPTYKNRQGLERLVLSTCELVRSNNAQDQIELCISDDASQDPGLFDFIREKTAGITISTSIQPVNAGFSRNLLKCVRMARGRYLAFAGDDDVFEAASFPAMLEALASGVSVLLFKTLPDASLTATGQPVVCNQAENIRSPAELVRKLGIFHSTFIGNMIIQRDLFLSQFREKDVLSLYPHTQILLRILEKTAAQFLPIPLFVFTWGGTRWNQPLLSAIDLARIYTGCFSGQNDRDILRLIYARQVRSIPRACLTLRQGHSIDFSNPHQSLSLRNVLDCYRSDRWFQIKAAALWFAGRFLPLPLLTAILGSSPAKVHFDSPAQSD